MAGSFETRSNNTFHKHKSKTDFLGTFPDDCQSSSGDFRNRISRWWAIDNASQKLDNWFCVLAAVNDVMDKIESKMALYQISCNNNILNGNQKFENLDVLLKEASPTSPQVTEKLGHHDHLVYIYTSGTTGLPKAAVISTSR